MFLRRVFRYIASLEVLRSGLEVQHETTEVSLHPSEHRGSWTQVPGKVDGADIEFGAGRCLFRQLAGTVADVALPYETSADYDLEIVGFGDAAVRDLRLDEDLDDSK